MYDLVTPMQAPEREGYCLIPGYNGPISPATRARPEFAEEGGAQALDVAHILLSAIMQNKRIIPYRPKS